MTAHLDPEMLPTPQSLAGMPADTPVLLALSGGADSSALLHILNAQRTQAPYPLFLAHVDHGIRGEEAARDREFCKSLAARYGLQIFVLNADIPALARERGQGIEETARAARYEYFAKLMREEGIPILVTAHHADDHLETVLFHLSRGSGSRGLCGIRRVRPFGDGVLVRPLLSVTRADVLEYCRAQGISYVTDSTNADLAFTRNRLRAEVTPVLSSLFPQLYSHVRALSASLAEDEDCLGSMAEDFFKTHITPYGIPLRALRSLPPAIAKRVLLLWTQQPCGALERVHLEALMALISGETPDAEVALPGAMCALDRCGMLCLTPKADTALTPYHIPFCEGEVTLPQTGIRILVQKIENAGKIHNLSTRTYIILTEPFDIISKDIFWRNRQEGDRLYMGGMHRKLRKLYRAYGIPGSWSRFLPVLCQNDEILWAPPAGASDSVRTPMDGESGYLLQILLPHEYYETVGHGTDKPTNGGI